MNPRWRWDAENGLWTVRLGPFFWYVSAHVGCTMSFMRDARFLDAIPPKSEKVQ